MKIAASLLIPAFLSLAATAAVAQDGSNTGGPWEGTYVGGSLGYAFDSSDRVGFRDAATGSWVGSADSLKVSGAVVNAHIGYRWQERRWVLGPELGLEFGNVSDESKGTSRGAPVSIESKISHAVVLSLKTGYMVNDDMFVYGRAGIVHAGIDYRGNGENGDYNKFGYVVGLGAEHRIDDQWSVYGEYGYMGLKREHIRLGDVTTEATPSYGQIKIGVNYKY